MAKYFYDNQIRRFLIQFARIFSNWYVTKGKDPAGNPIVIRVPIQYGDSSRMVAAIQASNSTSSLPSAPLITYYISGLEYDQKRTQDPYFIDKLSVRQRSFNNDTQSYESTQGQAFTVERLMPVPYTLRITVDFWTTNYQQKLELIEQLGVLFNPSMELQSTDNFIDWTSLSVVYQDGLTFSSRSIPVGNSNPTDIMTWKFYMPVWISSSAKIKKLGVIHKIIASIFQGNALTDMQDDDLLLGTRQKITPYGYKVLLVGNTLQILPGSQTFLPDNSDIKNITNILVSNNDNNPYTTTYTGNILYTRSNCSLVSVGQVIQFEGVSDNPTIVDINYDSSLGKTALTLSSTQTFNVGDNVEIYQNLNPNTDVYWHSVLNVYGTVRPGVSQIWLQNPYMETDIVGTIAFNPNDDRLLIYNIDPDTLPLNTIAPVNSVINPQVKGPYDVSTDTEHGLPAPQNGQRYLLVEDIGPGTLSWGDLSANANDIIEYNQANSKWEVVFDSSTELNVEYVTNLTSGVQYRWSDGVWMKSFEGWYDEGDYSIVI